MITFRQKRFIDASKVGRYIKSHPTLPISAGSLAVGTSGLYVAEKNRRQGREDRQSQTSALKNLNRTLIRVNKQLDDHERAALLKSVDRSTAAKNTAQKNQNQESSLLGFNIFKQKQNSEILDDAIDGAVIGSALATGTSFISRKNEYNIFGKFGKKIGLDNARDEKGKFNGDIKARNTIIYSLGGMIVGAALGALIGGTKVLTRAGQTYSDLHSRLLERIVNNLSKQGFIENKNFTTDPKIATRLKTRVCMTFSRVNGDLKIALNTANDPRLRQAVNEVLQTLPKSVAITENFGDKFNDFSITTLSNKGVDSKFITKILEQFIRRGYPVYLVEVG